MTEPEQWAKELWTEARRRHDVAKRSPGFYNQDAEMIAALTIQRTFEERERELREAMKGIETRHGWCVGKCRACDFARQALKETPDAR